MVAPKIIEKTKTINPTKRTFSRFSPPDKPKRITASKITTDKMDTSNCAIVNIKSAVPYSALVM